jgi:ferredoxin/flavodoxin---NADP+ reductase
MSDIFDLTIIGGGPVGLSAAGVAGEMGAQCYIIESRLHLGGIMQATYPDKDVYNFPGIQIIKGRDLVIDLIQKARAFGMVPRLGEYVTGISRGSNNSVTVKTNNDEYMSSTVIIASGLKAYYSPLTEHINIDDWNGSGIWENWPAADAIRGKKTVVLLNSSSQSLIPDYIKLDLAKFVWIVSDDSVSGDVLKSTAEIIKGPWEIAAIKGHKVPQCLVIKNNESGEQRSIDLEVLIALYDVQPRQTLFSKFGIETVGGQIKVDPRMQTSLKRVYAVGDIAYYPGKIKLLSTGIYEARIAVKNALKQS